MEKVNLDDENFIYTSSGILQDVVFCENEVIGGSLRTVKNGLDRGRYISELIRIYDLEGKRYIDRYDNAVKDGTETVARKLTILNGGKVERVVTYSQNAVGLYYNDGSGEVRYNGDENGLVEFSEAYTEKDENGEVVNSVSVKKINGSYILTKLKDGKEAKYFYDKELKTVSGLDENLIKPQYYGIPGIEEIEVGHCGYVEELFIKHVPGGLDLEDTHELAPEDLEIPLEGDELPDLEASLKEVLLAKHIIAPIQQEEIPTKVDSCSEENLEFTE